MKEQQRATIMLMMPIGNLVKDVQGGISSIAWTVYGKIKTITKSDGTTITYGYDPAGNRISKAVTINSITVTTWYVRDAQGNTLAVYNENAGTLKLTEQDIYGSSRLGIWNRNIDADQAWDQVVTTAARGNKNYELTNHLGNVLVTLSDVRKQIVQSNVITGYTPVVVSASDYYSFGMQQPGRTVSASGYRYGFNGKEKDGNINSAGDDYDFGARIYDPRIGRWLSVDPLQKKYPSFSTYNFVLNNPLFYQDLDGKDVGVTIIKGENGKPGTIIFSSTQFVTGVDASNRAQLYTDAFKKFVEANPGMKTSDGKWNVQVQMTFVAVDEKDVRLAQTKNATAESDHDNNASNIITLREATKQSRSNAKTGKDLYDKDENGKYQHSGTSAGNEAVIYISDKLDGHVAIHETLHLFGLGDYYVDGYYSQYTAVNNKTGATIVDKQVTPSSNGSISWEGYEGTIMAGDGYVMAQTYIDDLANKALEMSDKKASTSFKMSRGVDSQRGPNGQNPNNIKKVPQKVTIVDKNITVTTSKPVFRSAGGH